MKDKPPPDRRTFADVWDEIGYLHDKLLYWLYQRADPRKARRYAQRLERLLPLATPDHDAILGEECWSLVHEAKGDLQRAIESRQNEVRLIRRLHELSRGAPHEAIALKDYGYDDLSDCLDLLAILYHDTGDLDKAITTLRESRKLCQEHGVKFDAEEMLQGYIEEKRNSQKREKTMLSKLVVPLSQKQIEAAGWLYERHLGEWRLVDATLHWLQSQHPDFCPEVCVAKVTTIDALYSTGVGKKGHVVQMAEHVNRVMNEDLARGVMAKKCSEEEEMQLVDDLARLRRAGPDGSPLGRYQVFASKFCHFFIDPERFPIRDKFAWKRVKRHLGETYKDGSEVPYICFKRDFEKLKTLSGLASVSNKQLDRYLWLAGMFEEWEDSHDKKIGVSLVVKLLFENRPGDAANLLECLLPERKK